MGILSKKKPAAKKATAKKPAAKAPARKSFNQTVVDQYDKGASYQELADKHEVDVEKIAGIVEADLAKNEVKE